MFEALIPKLLSHTNVGIFSHVSPDGDCLGSQIALCLWLQKNGINATAFNEDTVPDNLSWLLEYSTIEQPSDANLNDFDAFVVVDGNALHRFGKQAQVLSTLGKPIYMIDHHPQPDDIFEAYVSKTDASSTCELIFNLYNEHNADQIDEASAKAMYTGIVTDTGSFQFDSVSPNTLFAASELLRRGDFRPNAVVDKLYSSRSLNQIELTGLAINTIRLVEGQQIAIMYVTKEMFEKTNTTKEDTEGLVVYPLSIKGVHAAVFFREDGDRIKLSLRSRTNDIDVNVWARELNGGGHKRASGAWHDGPLEKAIEEVIAIGLKQINN